MGQIAEEVPMATAPLKPTPSTTATQPDELHGLALVAHIEARLALAEAREAAQR